MVHDDPLLRKCKSAANSRNGILGRYTNIPRDNRTCTICNSGDIANELNVLFRCTNSKSMALGQFFSKNFKINPQFQNLSDEDKFKYALSFVDTSISLYSGNYIEYAK